MVKNLPAMQETQALYLGWDDPLEKGSATYSSILAWRIPWTLQSIGLQRVRHNWVTSTHSLTYLLNLCASSLNSFEMKKEPGIHWQQKWDERAPVPGRRTGSHSVSPLVQRWVTSVPSSYPWLCKSPASPGLSPGALPQPREVMDIPYICRSYIL